MAKWFIENDGPDPRFPPGSSLVTSTGRVGHITQLQFDGLSRTYASENKNMRVWAGLWGFWIKVVGAAIDFGKEPVIRIEPTNPVPTQVKGRPVPNLHIITEERHAYLLRCERELLAMQQPKELPTRNIGYSKAQQAGRKKSN